MLCREKVRGVCNAFQVSLDLLSVPVVSREDIFLFVNISIWSRHWNCTGFVICLSTFRSTMICGKGFKRKSNLQEHIPTHSDNRTFLCTICGRYLKTDNSYRRHMVCVHGVKYTCVVCRKDFSSQLGMQIHQRDKHGMTTWWIYYIMDT